jgi:sugar phosphate isomerase/epimerase
MKYAVMTFMYRGHIERGELSHEELVQLLADSGADGIEAFDRDFLSDPTLVPRYQAAMADAGIRMPVVDVMVNLVYTSATERQERLDDLCRGLDLCAAFSAEIAHVAGSKLAEGITPADGRAMMAELLAAVSDHASARGITLGIENFDPSPDLVCRGTDCLEIMRASGDVVKCVFDTGNFQAVKERADEQLSLLYNRICHCHFKDFQADDSPKGYHGAVFGEGIIPNQAVATELKRRGYDGWVALESYPQGGAGPRETIPRELATLRAMFGE